MSTTWCSQTGSLSFGTVLAMDPENGPESLKTTTVPRFKLRVAHWMANCEPRLSSGLNIIPLEARFLEESKIVCALLQPGDACASPGDHFPGGWQLAVQSHCCQNRWGTEAPSESLHLGIAGLRVSLSLPNRERASKRAPKVLQIAGACRELFSNAGLISAASGA